MGSRATGKRLRKLRMLPLIAASLVMVLASVPALAAQATDVVPTDPAAPPGQDDPASEPPGAAPGVCDHAAGEFLVGYASEEALRAAPPENVVETFDGILAQHLAFEEIKNIPDPAERLAAEEAKRQELGTRPGVAYAEYNCVATTQAASAEGMADMPTPASCGDCGRYVVDRAKKIIADGFGDAEGKDAFDAALEAAQSAGTDDENVAFASEIELDDEASADGGSEDNSESSSADEGEDADGSVSDDAKAGGSGSGEAGGEAGSGGAGGKAADDESGAGEEVDAEESSSGDTEDETEGEDSATVAEPVVGKNAAATTSEPREAGGTGGKVMALGAGTLLLAAGVYVARRTFWN
jgi:hypothetical protein